MNLDYMGIPCEIEFKKGERKTDPAYPESLGWELYADYGYIEDTVSNEEGEELDVYVGPDRDSKRVFLLPLLNGPDWDSFNEYKVLLGFKDPAAAKEFSNMQYFGGQIGLLMETPLEGFKEWCQLQVLKNQKEKIIIAIDDGYKPGDQGVEPVLVMDGTPQEPALCITS